MKQLLLLCMIAVSCKAISQQQTFDIINYTAPKTWKKKPSADALQFTTENASSGGYCIITLYKSVPGGDDPTVNFNASWDALVKETFSLEAAPEMQPMQEEDGWKALSGYASFEKDGTKGVALLVTTTGFGKAVNALILTNSGEYETVIGEFLGGINLKKPTVTNEPVIKTTATNTNNEKPATQTGYTFSSTNFDDGWVSTIGNDWILVTKEKTKVYLLYPVPYNAMDFSGTGVRDRDYYWDKVVSKYFTIETKQYNDNGEVIGSFQPDYVEGWARNKQTGERCFIGMRLSVVPKAAYITIAAVPDEATLRQMFPKANEKYVSDLANMSSYNKFAVGPKDLVGTWADSKTATMQWNYVTPSGYEGYAGMTVAATSATFNFNANGTYTSIHNGATGVVGALNTFQQNYKGKYTMANWNVTATNRWDGKTESFDASFEVIRGGRLLHLRTPGISYTLVKVK
jgi:hypothetical protein